MLRKHTGILRIVAPAANDLTHLTQDRFGPSAFHGCRAGVHLEIIRNKLIKYTD